jgi:hypothetical protein
MYSSIPPRGRPRQDAGPLHIDIHREPVGISWSVVAAAALLAAVFLVGLFFLLKPHDRKDFLPKKHTRPVKTLVADDLLSPDSTPSWHQTAPVEDDRDPAALAAPVDEADRTIGTAARTPAGQR